MTRKGSVDVISQLAVSTLTPVETVESGRYSVLTKSNKSRHESMLNGLGKMRLECRRGGRKAMRWSDDVGVETGRRGGDGWGGQAAGHGKAATDSQSLQAASGEWPIGVTGSFWSSLIVLPLPLGLLK